jgi:hypothetical protein
MMPNTHVEIGKNCLGLGAPTFLGKKLGIDVRNNFRTSFTAKNVLFSNGISISHSVFMLNEYL